jgi:hypothetical protein
MDVVATPIDQGMMPMIGAMVGLPHVFGASAERRVAEPRMCPANCVRRIATLSRLQV